MYHGARTVRSWRCRYTRHSTYPKEVFMYKWSIRERSLNAMKSKFLRAVSAVESLVLISRLFCFHSRFTEDPLLQQNFVWDFDLPEKYTKRHLSPGKDSKSLIPQSLGHISNFLLMHLAVSAAKEQVPKEKSVGSLKK